MLCVSCGTSVSSCRLRWFAACGILVPGPGIKPSSSTLQGVFLTTGTPGRSYIRKFYDLSLASHCSKSFSLLLNSSPTKSLEDPRQGLHILGLGEVLLVLHSSPRITMHRGRPCYTLIIRAWTDTNLGRRSGLLCQPCPSTYGNWIFLLVNPTKMLPAWWTIRLYPICLYSATESFTLKLSINRAFHGGPVTYDSVPPVPEAWV